MRNYLFLISIIFLTSCATYQNTTHSFTYHGTDNLGLDQDFFYTRYGVQGISSTSYALRTTKGDFLGGDVRSGLVADAKADLILQHPLEPNQAYANLSVDVMRTEKGAVTGTMIDLEKITISAVITADIIQYGKVPLNYELPIQTIRGAMSYVDDTSIESEMIFAFTVGEKVNCNFKGEIWQGEVLKLPQNGITDYTVNLNIAGKKRTKWISEKNLIKLSND